MVAAGLLGCALRVLPFLPIMFIPFS